MHRTRGCFSEGIPQTLPKPVNDLLPHLPDSEKTDWKRRQVAGRQRGSSAPQERARLRAGRRTVQKQSAAPFKGKNKRVSSVQCHYTDKVRHGMGRIPK